MSKATVVRTAAVVEVIKPESITIQVEMTPHELAVVVMAIGAVSGVNISGLYHTLLDVFPNGWLHTRHDDVEYRDSSIHITQAAVDKLVEELK